MFRFLMVCCFMLSGYASEPILEKQLYIVRNPQTKRAEFRHAIRKIGAILGEKIASEMHTKSTSITTVMNEVAKHELIDEKIVVVSILRAGLPMHEGILEVFPDAESGFLAMKRDEKTLKPTVFYHALPDLREKTVVLADPMIATGGSMLDAIQIIEKLHPKKVVVAGVMSTQVAMEKIRKHNPNIRIFSGVVDPILTNIGYISPGLGDAGDRAFGVKVD